VQHKGLDCGYGSRNVRLALVRAPFREAPLTRCFIGGHKGEWNIGYHALYFMALTPRIHAADAHGVYMYWPKWDQGL
jgi:hypothetical protein